MTLKKVRVPEVSNLLDKIQEALATAKITLEKSRQRQKRYADEKRRELPFALHSKVLLSTKNLSLKSGYTKKLLPRFIGPFKVTRVISPIAVELDLPVGVKWHKVFHTSLLRHYKEGGPIRAPPNMST